MCRTDADWWKLIGVFGTRTEGAWFQSIDLRAYLKSDLTPEQSADVNSNWKKKGMS